jgi:hypothetical protein
MRNCGICGRGLNQPLVPETMSFGGDCARCMADLGDRECVDLLKKLGDPSKRPAEVATYELWRAKQV